MTCLIVNHWEPGHEPRKSVQRTVQRGRVPRLSFIWKERQVFLESAQGSLLLLAEGWSPGPRGSVFANQWEGLVSSRFLACPDGQLRPRVQQETQMGREQPKGPSWHNPPESHGTWGSPWRSCQLPICLATICSSSLLCSLWLLIPHLPSLLKPLGCYGNLKQPRKKNLERF